MCDAADSIDALREALEARGLSTAGGFAELEERLVDAIATEQSDAADAFAKAEQSNTPDVSAMSIKELKEAITAARMRFDDCLDKTELRARAAEAVAAAAKAKASYQPESAAPSTAASMESSGSSGSMEQPGSASATMLLESVSGLSLKDLKALIQESGLSSDGCTDKSELRERACEALHRLMVPGAKCGAIGKPLVAELERQVVAVAAAEALEARVAKDAAREKQRAEAAAAEAEAAAAAVAAKKAREKAKRKEKKGRRKENKIKAQSETKGRETSDDGEGEEEAEAEGAEAEEEEEEDMLRRLAAARLQSNVTMVDMCGGGSLRRWVSAPDGEVGVSADAVDVTDAADASDGEDQASRSVPSGWRVERGLLVEEGESVPVSKKKKNKNKPRGDDTAAERPRC